VLDESGNTRAEVSEPGEEYGLGLRAADGRLATAV